MDKIKQIQVPRVFQVTSARDNNDTFLKNEWKRSNEYIRSYSKISKNAKWHAVQNTRTK